MIYIYVLYCPIANRVRYVGKTKNTVTRLSAHIRKAKKQLDHHCARWIRKLQAQGLEPSLEVIRRVPDGEDWQQAEMECIADYRAAGHPLTNMTSGGDGFHDLHPDILEKMRSPDGRQRMSDQSIALWEDNRDRMIAAMNNPMRVAKISAAMAKRNADPVFRAMVSGSEVRSRAAATLKATWSRRIAEMDGTEPGRVWRDKRSKIASAAWENHGARKRRTEIARDPEVNAKRSASLRATWARRKREAAQQSTEAA